MKEDFFTDIKCNLLWS